MSPGDHVTYEFWGRREEAVIVRVNNGIVWLDNGRWMHAHSCTLLNETS